MTCLNVVAIVLVAGIQTQWFGTAHVDAVSITASTFTASKKIKPSTKTGVPYKVIVPSLNVDLSVKQGNYNTQDQSWTLDSKNAFFADLSSPVNDQEGTSLIYGHNLPQVFAPLKNISNNAELVVLTENGYTFTYQYVNASIVTPEDVAIFSATSGPTMTLQTCSGDWDQTRTMYSFALKSVTRNS